MGCGCANSIEDLPKPVAAQVSFHVFHDPGKVRPPNRKSTAFSLL